MTRSGRFRRRLRLIQIPALVFLALMVCRLVQVQAVEHERYLEEGLSQWLDLVSLPAERGNIYDREGRSLALSATTWNVGLSPEALEQHGADAAERGCSVLARVLGLDATELRMRLHAADGHHVVVAKRVVLHRDSLAELRRLPGVSLDPCRDRIYPRAGLGASLIGHYRAQSGRSDIMNGLEQSLDPVLRGVPGEAWRHNTPASGPGAGFEVLTRAVDGQDVELSLDADLQAIAEDCLAEAVAECGGIGGVVLIVDPTTGDVLAAADTPVIRDRTEAARHERFWDNFNFTGVYEPGSVLKVFTSASLLTRAAVDTTLAIDCDDVRFDGYLVHNDEGHDFGPMAFCQAFVHSSNVYFARMVLNLHPDEFYRDMRLFGFGTSAGVAYPGDSRGIFHSPSRWSRRSQSTIAYGHEIAMTPLQLAMAGAAVANGGDLMAPRLVRRVRDKDGRVAEVRPPMVRQKVLSPDVARELRRVMALAVDEGTGAGAAVEWVSVAGKTGTAHKSIEGVRGYAEGKYMSSFLGMVPAENPRLVILTMIDEPDWRHHYASQSAAPLFARVVEAVGRTSPWLRDVVRGADRRAGRDEDGSKPERHELVEALVAGDDAVPTCPDLAGLSGREVRRLASRLGTTVAHEGAGYVVAQSPAPGEPVGEEGIRIVMEAPWR